MLSQKKKRRKIDRLLLAQSAEYSGWWLSHASEKYEFVRLDHHPNLVGGNKLHVPNHQPVFKCEPQKCWTYNLQQ